MSQNAEDEAHASLAVRLRYLYLKRQLFRLSAPFKRHRCFL